MVIEALYTRKVKMERNERWIKGYEGHYSVDINGNVFSFKGAKKSLIKINDGKGYKYVSLSLNGKVENKRCYRLVAETFLPNPDNLPMVNHKDGCRENDNIDNLEWCTAKHNITHGLAKTYYFLHTDGRGIFVRSLEEWCRCTGLKVRHIRRLISGERKIAYGFIFGEVYGTQG